MTIPSLQDRTDALNAAEAAIKLHRGQPPVGVFWPEKHKKPLSQAVTERFYKLAGSTIDVLRKRGWSQPDPTVMVFPEDGSLESHRVAVWLLGEGLCLSVGGVLYVFGEHRMIDPTLNAFRRLIALKKTLHSRQS